MPRAPSETHFRLALSLFQPILIILVGQLFGLATMNDCQADVISFDDSVWDHSDGNGPHAAWDDGAFIGVTAIGSESLEITTNAIGSTAYTADHFSRIDETYFSGFAFQLDPATTVNATTLDNYSRFDFSFSFPVQLNSFTLTDVDRTDGLWHDIVAAEGFSSSAPGAVGSGFAPNYQFESTTNMEEVTQFGLLAATPIGTSGNVTNTPENDVTFDFTQSIQSFSIYYWNENGTDDGATTQTIGIRGNEFEIALFGTAVPEPNGFVLMMLGLMKAASRRRRAALPSC